MSTETTTSEPGGPVVIEVRIERRATDGTEGFDQVVRDTLDLLARMGEQGEQLTVVAGPERTLGVVSVSDIMHRVLPSQVLVDPAIDPADAG